MRPVEHLPVIGLGVEQIDEQFGDDFGVRQVCRKACSSGETEIHVLKQRDVVVVVAGQPAPERVGVPLERVRAEQEERAHQGWERVLTGHCGNSEICRADRGAADGRWRG